MIIDAHAHACGPFLRGENLIGVLDQIGVDRVILVPGQKDLEKEYSLLNLAELFPTRDVIPITNSLTRVVTTLTETLHQIPEGNKYVYQLAQCYPNRILQFYWATLNTPGILEEVEKDYAAFRFRGIKLHQCWESFSTDSAIFRGIAKFATLNPPARSSIISASPDIKPLTLGPAALFFAVPCLAVTIAYYWGIPAMVELGLTEFAAYMVATLVPLAGCLVAAVAAYRLEGRPLTWAAFADRLRLHRMTRQDRLWALGGFLFTLIGFAIMDVAGILVSRGLISLPASLPPALNPLMRTAADYRELMGPGAVGNWNLVALVLAVLFFNVIGEELYFRGYILPRQELVHGRRTWLVHFVLWTLFHVFIYWQWLYIMFVTLPVSYVAYRQRNTWTGIIIHGLHNAADMSLFILTILGILV